jgi:hypothetical protein
MKAVSVKQAWRERQWRMAKCISSAWRVENIEIAGVVMAIIEIMAMAICL